MRQIARNKSDYIRLIIIYKHKRDHVKSEYKRGDPAYAPAVKRINQKIGTYKNACTRIDGYNAILNSINNRIKEYYSLSMYKCTTNWKIAARKKSILWKLFCKYAVEKGIPNLYISNYIGWKKKRAVFYRMEITRKMQTNDIIKQEWAKFKKFMDRVPQQKIA